MSEERFQRQDARIYKLNGYVQGIIASQKRLDEKLDTHMMQSREDRGEMRESVKTLIKKVDDNTKMTERMGGTVRLVSGGVSSAISAIVAAGVAFFMGTHGGGS